MFGGKTYSTNTQFRSEKPASSNGPSGDRSKHRDLPRIALEEVVRPLAISVMLTCIIISIAQLVNMIIPEWPGRLLSILTFLVCLESIHAKRLLTRLQLDSTNRLRFRFVEWTSILLVVRFAVYTHYGSARLMSDIANWSINIGSFFSGEFLLNSFLIIVFWTLALMLSSSMQELEASPIETKSTAATDPNYYLYDTMPHHGQTDRQLHLKRITSIFAGGGIALLVFAGLSRVNVRDLIAFEHSSSSGIILNVLAYFLIGFLLISQAQYTILKARWEIEGIPVTAEVGKRWIMLVLSFLFLLGFVSALLPVGYSVGIVSTLSAVLQWLIYAITQVAFSIIFIISSLLALLISLVSGTPTDSSSPTRRVSIPPSLPPTAAHQTASWWPLVRSLAFWTVLVGIVTYSVFHFLHYRWNLFQNMSIARLLHWLGKLWKSIRTRTQKVANKIRTEIARRLVSSHVKTTGRPWRYISLRRLSLRDRVRYLYLSILQRSAKQGFRRPPSATPSEYQKMLIQEIPEAVGQFDELTEAFIEARYSQHAITQDHISIVHKAWRQMKRVLRTRRRRSE